VLTPVILAAQETEIRRIAVQSQSGQIVLKTLSQKNSSQKRASGVAQSESPEYKPQYHRKKNHRKGLAQGPSNTVIAYQGSEFKFQYHKK
jgi:hypothetical protein